MQLLIVHRDAGLGAQLVQMVKDYSPHRCQFVETGQEAIEWARSGNSCHFLLTQLDAPNIDGLALGASLSELFPKLQTAFLPAYPAGEERLDVRDRKVFPEPIHGEALLQTLNRAESAGADLFHVVDVLQMCCLSGRSGALQLVRERDAGFVFLRQGQIVHAEAGEALGVNGLNAVVAWEYVEFAYDATVEPPERTIMAPWDVALIDAVLLQKQAKSSQQGAPAQPPRRLGDYDIERRIGEDAWGDIYAAKQLSVDRPVKLHLLRHDSAADPGRPAEFMANARAQANVQHPRIISVYEAGEADGTFFFASEALAGETLAEKQKRQAKLSEAEAFEMIDAVADAAAYLRQRNVSRLPIRPDAIFLAADGTTRLRNLAVASALQPKPDEKSEIQALGRLLTPMMNRTMPGPGIIPRLIHRMQSAQGFATWSALAAETAKIDRRALAAVAAR